MDSVVLLCLQLGIMQPGSLPKRDCASQRQLSVDCSGKGRRSSTIRLGVANTRSPVTMASALLMDLSGGGLAIASTLSSGSLYLSIKLKPLCHPWLWSFLLPGTVCTIPRHCGKKCEVRGRSCLCRFKTCHSSEVSDRPQPCLLYTSDAADE